MPTSPRQRPTAPAQLRVLEILRDRREELGISQEALAAHVGVSQSQMSKYLAGDRDIGMTELLKVCELLELRPSELLAAAAL